MSQLRPWDAQDPEHLVFGGFANRSALRARCTAALLGLSLAPAWSSAQEETTLLRTRYEVGQTIYFTTATHVENQMRFGDQTIPNRQDHREVGRLVVDAERADGGVDVTYTNLHNFSIPRSPEEERLSEILRGLSLGLVLSPQGEVLELRGHAKLIERLSGGDAATAAAIADILNEENLRNRLADTLVALPGRAMATGESWTKERSMSLGALGSATVAWTLRVAGPQVEDGRRLLRVELEGGSEFGSGAASPASGVRILDGRAEIPEGEAWLTFDPELGRVIRVKGSLRAEFQLEFEMQGETTRGDSTLVMTTDTRFLEDPLETGESPPPPGFDAERDPARLAALFERACSDGDALGCLQRARQLAPRAPTDPQRPESVDWIRRGADLGFAPAQVELADHYLAGTGVPQSFEEARRYYRLAADQNLVGAAWRLEQVDSAEEAALEGDPTALTALLESRCDDGRAQGCFELGRRSLASSEDPRRPPARALELVARAAELGHAEASRTLGGLHLRGAGVPRDEAEARRHYAIAAAAGDYYARRMLERLDGRAAKLEGADAERLSLLRTRAEGGGVRAMLELGGIYEEADYEELAEDWLWRASEGGLALADHSLGELYSDTNAAAHDEVAATRCYRRAAERELPEGQYELGRRLADGEGVSPDAAEALRWLQLAAEQGHDEARLRAAHAYYAGLGVEPDPVEATRLLVRPFAARIWGHRLQTAAASFSVGLPRGLDVGSHRDLAWAGLLLSVAGFDAEDAGEKAALRDRLAALEGQMTGEERSAYDALRAARSADEAWHTAACEAFWTLRRSDFAGAEQRGLEALAEAEKARGPDHIDVAMTLHFLAFARSQGSGEGVREPLEQDIRIREALQGPGHRRLVTPLLMLAEAVPTAEAEPLLRRALAIAERADGADSSEVADVLEPLADGLLARDDAAQAMPLLERALSIRERDPHSAYAHVEALRRLARAHEAQGDTARAEERLVAAQVRAEGQASALALALDSLARLYMRGDRWADAERVFRRLLEASAGDELLQRLYVPSAANGLGLSIKEQGRAAEALPFYEQACDLDAEYCGGLGYLYLLGQGVDEDEERATALFERSCEAGQRIPCASAGDAYRTGQGAPQDPERAAALYRRSCDLGYDTGCEELEYLAGRPRPLPRQAGLPARSVGEMTFVAVVGEPGSEAAVLVDADRGSWTVRAGDALLDAEVVSVGVDSLEIDVRGDGGVSSRRRLALFDGVEPEPIREDDEWTGALASVRFEGDLPGFAHLLQEAFGLNACVERQAEAPIRVAARQQPWDGIVGTALANAGLGHVIDRNYFRVGVPAQLDEMRLLGHEPEGHLVSFAFQRGHLEDLARLFQDISGRPVDLPPSDAPRLVTVAIREVPWDEALELIVSSLGGRVTIGEGRIVISDVP